MANIKSAIKRNRQNEKRRLNNRVFRGSARTFLKKANLAIENGEKEAAEIAVKRAISALDKAASKGVVHKNNASRRKSRLLKRYRKEFK
ncbi:MAG: 30S ribosomal protein S20 [Anaerolineaceae bacterium]|nr:30S ribosomal protein S20 [Anaerolineaceae bacterium]